MMSAIRPVLTGDQSMSAAAATVGRGSARRARVGALIDEIRRWDELRARLLTKGMGDVSDAAARLTVDALLVQLHSEAAHELDRVCTDASYQPLVTSVDASSAG